MDALISKSGMPAKGAAQVAAPSWGIYDSVESFFDMLGLMRGNWAIVKRFAFGASIGAIVMLWLQPRFSFYRGQFRPWKALGDRGDVPATWVPFWSIVLVSGLLPALFI